MPFILFGVLVASGQRDGLISFGRRDDVYLPEGTNCQVVLGQRSVAGETVLGRTDAPTPTGITQ